MSLISYSFSIIQVSASSELAISPKTPLLVQENKSIRSVVGQICRPSNRMTRQQRSSKRLGSSSSQASTSQGFTSNLSSISENVSAVADLSSTTHDKSSSASPTAKHMFLSTQLKCATESIDLQSIYQSKPSYLFLFGTYICL